MIDFNKYLNKTVKVTWLDACGEQNVDDDELKDKTPSDLLIPNVSYGVLYKVDDKGIIIISEDGIDRKDYTCIPIGWTIQIRKLKETR
jgi:hypothetical protein